MSTVSVIVPAYNCGRFIGDAMTSILKQTRLPEEILVVDDGSTDGTESVVRGVQDPRIRYVRQANAGVSAARNRGLAEASGDLIAFLDADDRWRPTMLEKQATVLDADPRVVCSFTNFIRFEHETGRFLSDQFRYFDLHLLATAPGPVAGSRIVDGDAFSALIQFGVIPAFTPTMLFRRTAIGDLAFNERLRICEDTEFALRVFMKGAVAFNEEVLAEIRRHEGNTTKDYSMVAVHELVALQGLDPYVVGSMRRRVYTDRVVKAHIDGACALIANGQPKAAIATYGRSFRVRGSYLRKAKGAVRLALTAAARA